MVDKIHVTVNKAVYLVHTVNFKYNECTKTQSNFNFAKTMQQI